MDHVTMPTGQKRVEQTSRLLRQLLEEEPRYRGLWRQKVRRLRGSDLSQAAVADVIANHLWDVGERADTRISLAREIKDRIRRALCGDTLSGETLRWFVDAFGLSEEDARRLWRTFTGDSDGTLGIGNTMTRSREMIRRQWHRTLSIVERYAVGPDGSLVERHTWHTIRAREDGVSAYLFNHEPYASRVRVLHGGSLGRQFEYGGGLRSQDIVLDHPLLTGETTALEYVTEYPADRADVREVRRPARGRCENIDLGVMFHPDRLPSAVYWCTWRDHIEGQPVQERPVQLHLGAVRRFVPFIEQTVIGFRWVW